MVTPEEYKKYKNYLHSAKWKRKRQNVLKHRDNKCENCGSSKNLQVHHKTYINLYSETLFDLELLCGECHMKEHNIPTDFQKKVRLMEKKKRKKKKKRRWW